MKIMRGLGKLLPFALAVPATLMLVSVNAQDHHHHHHHRNGRPQRQKPPPSIYPNDHWNYSKQLTVENFEETVQAEIDAGRTFFVRWIASPG